MDQPADALCTGAYEPGELMGVIAGELRARGMNIREYCRGGVLRELEITNPQDPDKGKVTIGYDGLTTWEFWSRFSHGSEAEKLVNIIAAVLTQNLADESIPETEVEDAL
jgi:hypothetical protein